MEEYNKTEYDREKELKSLDNTKTGVKGLVDAGVEKIPKIFVRPSDELLQELGTQNADRLQVPVIDLARIHNRREEIIREILEASEKWGFFQVVNHGIPLSVLKRMLEGTRMFHEQESEVKKELYTREMGKEVVYHTNYDLYKSKAANWRDTLTVNTAFNGHLDRQLLPPICRDIIVEYTSQVTKLGDILLELLSLGLGLRPEYLGELECYKGWSCVCHYYPTCPQPELTLGSSRHSDPSFLTVVLQDQIGGLQVIHDDQWVDVRPIPGALVVNIGDILQMISNDKLKSVNHRVKANLVGPRISVAFFFSGLFTSPKIYGPIKELISAENPAIYREFTISEFVTHFFSRPLDEPGFKRFLIRT